MGYEPKHSGRRAHHNRSSSNNDSQLKLLKQIKEELDTIRSRQREMYEVMLSYKQDMYDLKTQVLNAIKNLPESPYIAGRMIPAPREVDEFELFEDIVKTYLHRQTLPPSETDVASESSDEESASEPKKRRRRQRKRRRKSDEATVSVESIEPQDLEPPADEPEEEVGEVDELVPNAELPEQAFEDTATIFREEVMTEELQSVFDDNAIHDRDDEEDSEADDFDADAEDDYHDEDDDSDDSDVEDALADDSDAGDSSEEGEAGESIEASNSNGNRGRRRNQRRGRRPNNSNNRRRNRRPRRPRNNGGND